MIQTEHEVSPHYFTSKRPDRRDKHGQMVFKGALLLRQGIPRAKSVLVFMFVTLTEWSFPHLRPDLGISILGTMEADKI
jgi:hypothetical protein